MLYRFAADVVLAMHFAFILFVAAGGLAASRYPKAALLHVPAAAWGAFVELSGRRCPLTDWENALRLRAGESGYSESFIEHYVLPLIYPTALTRGVQLWLAAGVVATNIAVYGYLAWRRRSTAHRAAPVNH
jgi:hypothetical protein